MKKKILSLLLAALLMFTMTVSVWAGDDDKVELRAEVANGQVSLVITANEDTFNGKLIIRYDRSELTYVDADCAATVYSDQPEKGTVTLGYALSTADTLKAGEEIATLHFENEGDWIRSKLYVTVENWNEQIGLEQKLDRVLAHDGSLTPVGPAPDEPVTPAEPVTPDEPVTPAEDEWPFIDVGDSWYREYVRFVYENGIMTGVTANTFEPDTATTRGMIVTMLARMEGVDTSGSPWYAAGQAWAMENGISDGTDMPGVITREQLVTMLYRYAQLKGYDVSARAELQDFADAESVSVWAQDAMQWAVAVGLIQGNNGQLNPAGSASRAETATIITRFMQYFAE